MVGGLSAFPQSRRRSPKGDRGGGTGKCPRLRHHGPRRLYESWEAAPEGGRRIIRWGRRAPKPSRPGCDGFRQASVSEARLLSLRASQSDNATLARQAFILGGTGQIGRAVARNLLDQGWGGCRRSSRASSSTARTGRGGREHLYT